MNCRERYLATAAFQPVDRTFLLPPWLWETTRTRWHAEGLPKDVDFAEHFHTDVEGGFPLAMQGRYGPHLWPSLERKVLSETADQIVVQDEEGNVVCLFKNDPCQSMPEWIEYPMKNRADWEGIIKPRLDATIPGRYPQGPELDQRVEEYKRRDYPLGLWAGSFYGWPRSFLGVERISTMFYDDPVLIHEMCEHMAEFAVQTLTPILKRVQFDFAYLWEDMAGKTGPLCSPATYREFCFAPLQRVTHLLHRYGVHNIIVDSDGNNDVLIPLWLEAGVTGLRFFEIAADCDAVAARKRYGKHLIIQGAIDKRALAQNRKAIEREVLSKVPWLCLQGGYFPVVDHLIPPDVSLANFTYYARLLRAVTEEPERYLREAKEKGYWPGGKSS